MTIGQLVVALLMFVEDVASQECNRVIVGPVPCTCLAHRARRLVALSRAV